MIYDLQKASVLKRISAYILDVIALAIVVVGIGSLLSAVLGYDTYNQKINEYYDKYETQYNIKFDISAEEYAALKEDDAKRYDEAYAALLADKDAIYTYNMLLNLTLVITTVSIFLGYIALEFIVPIVLKNGQTIGKKVFGIALMRTDGVKLNNMMLFVRTVLGKFTIETMIPVLILIMIYFNSIGIVGAVVLALLLLLQLILIISTRTNSLIHDLLAGTVAVDLASQMIFENEEAMIEYKKRIHAEAAARQDY